SVSSGDLLEARPAPCRVVANQPVLASSADRHEVEPRFVRLLPAQQMQPVRDAPAHGLVDGGADAGAIDPREPGDCVLRMRVVPAQEQTRAFEKAAHHSRPGRARTGRAVEVVLLARRQIIDHRACSPMARPSAETMWLRRGPVYEGGNVVVNARTPRSDR